jgi:hypothetical protein
MAVDVSDDDLAHVDRLLELLGSLTEEEETDG